MVVYRKNYQCGINISPQKYKHVTIPGNYRPFNFSPDIHSSSLSINNSNEFKARPLKHWRKQYANSNKDPRQTYQNHTLINNYMQPGGYIIHDMSECKGDCYYTVNGTIGIDKNLSNSCDTSGSSFDYITCSNERNCIKYDMLVKHENVYCFHILLINHVTLVNHILHIIHIIMLDVEHINKI